MHDLVAFRTLFEPEFSAYLAARAGELQEEMQDAALQRYVAHAIALADGGKRIRPYLCAVAYSAAGGSDADVIARLGISIECFQMFCLLQDDIMDRALLRHGKPALHRFIGDDIATRRERGDAFHVGEGHAMLLADIYFSWSQACVFGARELVHTASASRISDEYQAMIRRVITGQMLDVDFTTRAHVSQADITRKMQLKTSGYSFVSPMAIGLAAANAPHTATVWATQFGEALGEAFQLQDDMLDIYRDASTTGKPNLGDIREGQRTFLTQYVMEHGDSAAQQALQRMLGDVTFVDVDAARALFRDSGAEQACLARCTEGFARAEELLAVAPFADDAKERLQHIVDLLRHRL